MASKVSRSERADGFHIVNPFIVGFGEVHLISWPTYFRDLVRFALDKCGPDPSVWIGGGIYNIAYAVNHQPKDVIVWALGDLSAWIKIAYLVEASPPRPTTPPPRHYYPTLDVATMACLHRRPVYKEPTT